MTPQNHPVTTPRNVTRTTNYGLCRTTPQRDPAKHVLTAITVTVAPPRKIPPYPPVVNYGVVVERLGRFAGYATGSPQLDPGWRRDCGSAVATQIDGSGRGDL